MMRPKKSAKDLPPRMLRRFKRMKSGKLWTGYYYNGRDENGKRKELPLGTDLNEAKRKWAEFECKPVPSEVGLMKDVFDRYIRDVLPGKAYRTQKNNLLEFTKLRSVFDTAPIDSITPQHIAQYRDARRQKMPDGTHRPAPISANRELALLSHVWNMAREWGYTAKENPVTGIRKNKEKPRDYYADDVVWQAVRRHAGTVLRDAMDLAYFTGQRPADILKFRQSDIVDDALTLKQNKTGKRLRILLTETNGQRNKLGLLIDRIRSRKVASVFLLATDRGNALTRGMLRVRFCEAREIAAREAETQGEKDLAQHIRAFQFRDTRAKAASETDLTHASQLLGHSDKQITQTVYRRVGETVKPM
ncbi:integrase [Betaproteobacteria bacterium]|nr:integrase [Betaproteobacteria bacterium]